MNTNSSSYAAKIAPLTDFLQLPSPACTPIGLIGPFARRAVAEGHKREHENAPSLRTPKVVWIVLLWGLLWRPENATY